MNLDAFVFGVEILKIAMFSWLVGLSFDEYTVFFPISLESYHANFVRY